VRLGVQSWSCLAVAYGSGMAPFQENRSRFHSRLAIIIDVFHCANQSLDADCVLPVHFWSRRGFNAVGANPRSVSWLLASFALLTPRSIRPFPPPSPIRSRNSLHWFRDLSHSKTSTPLSQSLASFSESNCLTISVRLNFLS
jgi:hypothetical protein